MTDMPPPDAVPAPDLPPPPAVPAKPPSKIRLYIVLGVIVAFLGFVLWSVRDSTAADDLAIGTCFDRPTSGADFSTVTKHACTEAHDAEVFQVVEYTGGSTYPITLTIENFVDDACTPVFETYVGEPFDTSETYGYGYFYPNRDGWDGGDRTVTCYVVRSDEAKLTQSVKGIAG